MSPFADMASPGEAETVDLPEGPPVLRIREDNPGMFTGPGTNTFLIGESAVWILDPGEDRDDGHREAIERAVDGRTVNGILISHGHADHWPLGQRLASEWQVETYGFHRPCDSQGDGFRPSQPLHHLQEIAGDGYTLTCLHTPGHCADHLSFALKPELDSDAHAKGSVIFCADHVMAWSTTILAPPDGNLNDYLASLELLLDLNPTMLLPAHGPSINDPIARMIELREHRLARTQQLLNALNDEAQTLDQIAPSIYVDTDPKLFGAAAASLSAHADALLEDGRITREGDGFRLTKRTAATP